MRWAWPDPPALPLDPVRVPTSWSGLEADPGAQILADLTMRSLLRPSATGWSPDLAARYDYDSRTRTAVLHLDETARWSDGSPVTAADVVATLGRAKRDTKSPFHAAALALVDPGGLTAAADGTVHLIFRPDVPAGPAFAQLVTMGIAPAGGVALDGGSYQVAAGSLVARTDGSAGVTLFANPHSRGPAGATRLRFLPLPDGATPRDVGRALDVAPVTAAAWTASGEAAGQRLLRRPLGSVALLAFNTRPRVDGPVLDAAVRGALATALDPSTISAAAGPDALPASLPLPALGQGAQAIQAALAAHPAGRTSTPSEASASAARALDGVGWTKSPDGRRQVDGAPVLLHLAYVAGDSQLERVASAVASAWTSLGVKTELMPLGEADFAKRVYLDHSFDAAVVLWQPEDPFDPAPLYRSGSRFNVAGWSDAASDAALAAAEGAVDFRERLAALGDWWRAAEPSCAYLPLYVPASLFVARPDLQGLDPSAPDFGAAHWTVGSR